MTKCTKCNKRSSRKRDNRFDFSQFVPQIFLQPSSVSLTGGTGGAFNPGTIIASGTGLNRITSATILFAGCTNPLPVTISSAASLISGLSGFPGFPGFPGFSGFPGFPGFPKFGKKSCCQKKSKCDDGFSQIVLTLPLIPTCATAGTATITFFSGFNSPTATLNVTA